MQHRVTIITVVKFLLNEIYTDLSPKSKRTDMNCEVAFEQRCEIDRPIELTRKEKKEATFLLSSSFLQLFERKANYEATR